MASSSARPSNITSRLSRPPRCSSRHAIMDEAADTPMQPPSARTRFTMPAAVPERWGRRGGDRGVAVGGHEQAEAGAEHEHPGQAGAPGLRAPARIRSRCEREQRRHAERHADQPDRAHAPATAVAHAIQRGQQADRRYGTRASSSARSRAVGCASRAVQGIRRQEEHGVEQGG